jgi:hypothetical protein
VLHDDAVHQRLSITCSAGSQPSLSKAQRSVEEKKLPYACEQDNRRLGQR